MPKRPFGEVLTEMDDELQQARVRELSTYTVRELVEELKRRPGVEFTKDAKLAFGDATRYDVILIVERQSEEKFEDPNGAGP
jgi:hypothetical protein